jgi:hypothetical protein
MIPSAAPSTSNYVRDTIGAFAASTFSNSLSTFL